MPPPLARETSRRSMRMRERERVETPVSRFHPMWELFEGIPTHYPLRTRVRMKLKFSELGTAWEIFQTAFAVLVSAAYVARTYSEKAIISEFETTAMVVFAADYFLNLYCCESRWRFILSFNGIMDALTIFPALVDHVMETDDGTNALPFIRFIRVMRMLRLMRVVRAAGSQSVSAVQKQIYTIMLLITCLVFIAAGIFHAVESNAQPNLTFGDALYFIVATISTVGYGDITASTAMGRAVAAGVIIVSFTVIPAEISRLTHLMALQSHFRTTYRPFVGKPHILVVGHVTEPRALLAFFREFYHPDRALDVRSSGSSAAMNASLVELPCVIVGPKEPTEEVINLLDHPVLQNRVTYIKGSVMSEEDMCRVGADAARACFVLAAKTAANTKQTDAETVLRLMAIRDYNPELPVYSQIVSPVFLDYVSGFDADHMLCLDQIKLSLLAKSCLCPGLVTLVSNLFRSSALAVREHLADWEVEYTEGMALEVYATTLPPPFYGITFSQACELLYRISHGEVILLAVYEQSKHVPSPSSPRRHTEQPAQMLSNPGSSVTMCAGQLVYVLSESKKLTVKASITAALNEWLGEGNVLPTRMGKPKRFSVPKPPPQRTLPSLVTSSLRREDQCRVAEPVRTRASAPGSPRRREEEVLLEEAKYPSTGLDIKNHVVVVSDLEPSHTLAFARMLRLQRHVPGSSDYHPIIFLSWASSTTASSACRVLREYDDIFVMLADGDSKSELLRANVLTASRCVVLADKSTIQELDGEAIDSHTIFHYLAVLAIQAEYGLDTTSGLMPMVELSMPRTMKILDTVLKKRTASSMEHRQHLDSLVEATTPLTPTVVKAAEMHPPIERRDSSAAGVGNSKLRPTRVRTSIVKNIADNLDRQVKLRKQLSNKLSLIRREQEGNRRHYFDVRGTALLPFFAAGYGFSDDVFDNMLCQSYFTPGLIRFIYEILFSENGHPAARSGTEWAFGSQTASSLLQIPVPAEFIGKTFGELFLDLLSTKEIVAIGLYRGTGAPFRLPYVATGPASDTMLAEDDLVFVLAHPDALNSFQPKKKPDVQAEAATHHIDITLPHATQPASQDEKQTSPKATADKKPLGQALSQLLFNSK